MTGRYLEPHRSYHTLRHLEEYARVPDMLFRLGRAKLLKQFLARPSI